MNGFLLLARTGWKVALHFVATVREQSYFKLAFSTCFIATCMVGLFFLFYGGFRFLDEIGGIGLLVIHRLFALFFFGLGFILVMSSALSSYTTLYLSKEVPYLLLRPVSLTEIISYKYLETTALASWAFFVVIVPYVAAYAYYEQLHFFFSLWTLLYSVPFVFICSAFGTLVSMLLVRILPRGRGLALLVALLIGSILVFIWRGFHGVVEDMSANTTLVLQRLVPGFQLASHPLWPSHWVAEGIMSMSRERYGRGALYLLLLFSYVGVGVIAVQEMGKRTFYNGWQRVISSTRQRKREAFWFEVVRRVLFFLPADFRALFMKDLRIFFRDPAQWTQGLIFFGILGFYFVNLRNMNYHTLPSAFRNLIAFLNVFSVASVMCAMGARFVYPQLSLEGQGFWIVGMSPTTMGRVLMAKFLTSSAILLAISIGLMLISLHMLQVTIEIRTVSLVLTLALSLGLSGLATGLGSVYLDLKQRNPAAIISSFGGTLNLVLSLVFVLAAILPFAVFYHFQSEEKVSEAAFHVGLLISYGWLALLILVSVAIPLALGWRSLVRRDY